MLHVTKKETMSLNSSGALATSVGKTAVHMYRDCLRLVKHVAGNSKKAVSLKVIVGKEFRKNAAIKDPAVIDALKGNAVRALANFLMMESAAKDEKFKNRITKFAANEVASIQDEDKKGPVR